MKSTTFLLAAVLLVGCTTQHKVEHWLDNHPEQDAERCAIKYPPKDSLVVRPDTMGYERDVKILTDYADSVTQIAYLRNKAIAGLKKLLDINLSHAGSADSLVEALHDQIDSLVTLQIDVPRLQRDIEKKVRATLKPCPDSVHWMTNTAQRVADSLRILRLQQDSVRAVQLDHGRKSLSTVSRWWIQDLLHKWWFWLLVVLLLLYITRDLWMPKSLLAIKSIFSKLKS